VAAWSLPLPVERLCGAPKVAGRHAAHRTTCVARPPRDGESPLRKLPVPSPSLHRAVL